MNNDEKSLFYLSYSLGSKNITHQFEEELLSDVLMNLEDFLRGCGFVFKGNLQIVEDDWDICMNTPYDHTHFDYDDEFVEGSAFTDDSVFEDVENEEVESKTDSKVWNSTVESIMKVSTSNEKCTICGITRKQLGDHNCWDEKCTFSTGKKNAD